MRAADEQRLRAAGWELAPVFSMVTLLSEVGDDELTWWRSPSGETVTEKQALERLEREEDDG